MNNESKFDQDVDNLLLREGGYPHLPNNNVAESRYAGETMPIAYREELQKMIKGFERTHITMDLRRYADGTYMNDVTADKFNTYRSGWFDGQEALGTEGVQKMRTYCLAYTHEKCDSCQHQTNWKNINEMPNVQRLHLQEGMERINSDKCRMTNMGEYISTVERGIHAI